MSPVKPQRCPIKCRNMTRRRPRKSRHRGPLPLCEPARFRTVAPRPLIECPQARFRLTFRPPSFRAHTRPGKARAARRHVAFGSPVMPEKRPRRHLWATAMSMPAPNCPRTPSRPAKWHCAQATTTPRSITPTGLSIPISASPLRSRSEEQCPTAGWSPVLMVRNAPPAVRNGRGPRRATAAWRSRFPRQS